MHLPAERRQVDYSDIGPGLLGSFQQDWEELLSDHGVAEMVRREMLLIPVCAESGRLIHYASVASGAIKRWSEYVGKVA